MVKDADAVNTLIPKALELIKNDPVLEKLSGNILKMAENDSAERIANEVIKLIKQ